MRLNFMRDGRMLRFLREVALALTIIGAGLGMYLNFYLGNMGWNNLLMLFALVFIPNWANLTQGRLYPCPFHIKVILFFQIYVFYAMLIGGASSTDYIYLFFTLIFIFGILTLRPGSLNWKKVIDYTWIFGWFCLLLCTMTIVTGAFFIEFAKTHDGTGYESILVDLTMAGNLINFIITCLYIIRVSQGLKVKFSIIGIIMAMTLIFILGKRTPLITACILIILFQIRFYPPSRYIKKKTVFMLIGVFMLGVILSQLPIVRDTVLGVFERTISGILDMLLGSSISGQAAVTRYSLRSWAIEYIVNEFGVLNYVFGVGYMTRWLDAPLLQSYLDLGLIGFGFYLYIVILKPLKIIFSPLEKVSLVFWTSGLCVYNILSSMNSGIPYTHVRWIPLVLLFISIRDIRLDYSKTTISLSEDRNNYRYRKIGSMN